MTLLEFFKRKYSANNDRYNPISRVRDIGDIIEIIKRDGLRVSCKDNCIYVENTVSKTISSIKFNDDGSISIN